MTKFLSLFCAVAVIIQTITCQNLGPNYNGISGTNGLAGLQISRSSIAPNGFAAGQIKSAFSGPCLTGSDMSEPSLGQAIAGLDEVNLRRSTFSCKKAEGYVGLSSGVNSINPSLRTGLNLDGIVSRGIQNPGFIGAMANPALAPGPLSRKFSVSSTSSGSPTGISVLAKNLAYEGSVSVGGQLPFSGTVELEGRLANVGSGFVSYGCGNQVGISSQGAVDGNIGSYSVGGPTTANGPYGLLR